MHIAFYAPLKSPDHPIPSGDRQIAQLLIEALRRAGHEPFLASRLRSFDPAGDPERQARLSRLGDLAAGRLLRRWQRRPADAPDLWFTYHLYYKAPDWIGPRVSAALGVPYVIAEASHAPKRAGGAWDIGHRAVEQALRQADAVIGLNPVDREGVLSVLPDARRWVPLPPFLDASAYDAEPDRKTSRPVRLITVAMMREGDKLASYRLLGSALERLLDLPWSLDVVGDGPARMAVEQALSALGPRITYHGALEPAAIRQALQSADLLVWPAINEAFGMALLEAQASRLPVVAGNSGGVGAIVADGQTGVLTPPGAIAPFAAAVRRLMRDDDVRRKMGVAARAKVQRDHDLPAAAARLGALLERLGAARAA
jgi:glycosyltransferase involved in cell wall biosynthesis